MALVECAECGRQVSSRAARADIETDQFFFVAQEELAVCDRWGLPCHSDVSLPAKLLESLGARFDQNQFAFHRAKP